jgi:S1-C subfamily serine protease
MKPPLAWLGLFLAVALIAGAVSGSAVALLLDDDDSTAEGEVASEDSRAPDDVISEVAATAMQGVVTIINEGAETTDEAGNIIQSYSSGSGVIFDASGLVVTNEHVVREPGTLSVVLSNGEQRPAQLVSHDAPFNDLAVLRIPGGGLRSLPFGDSAELTPGQTVIAIGSALFEYDNSVTAGIVSGLGRRYLREGIFMEDLIQTDAAINTGNSGGPLVTLDGRVVGLVSNVVRRIAGFENIQGISFAISSRTMAPILDSIKRSGSYPRPYFGVEHLDLDVPTATQLGLPTPEGALVQRVISGSPAASAGIRQGDVILVIGNSEINEGYTFLNALSVIQANARVPVRLLRGTTVMDVAVQVVPR